jgi:ComF family protein
LCFLRDFFVSHIGHNLLEAVLDVVFPPHCPICSVLMGRHDPGGGLCPTCEKEFPRFALAPCSKCAAELGPHVDSSGCFECAKHQFRFDRAFTLGPFDGIVRDLILRAKYNGSLEAASLLGRRLAVAYPQLTETKAVVVPVPMYWRGRVRRTYNQAHVIASAMARPLKLDVEPGWLKCVRNTPSQVGLTHGQRRANIKDSFVVPRRSRLKGQTVILVDDVMTSGATCDEATKALKRAGAKEVCVVVAARAQIRR